MTGTDVITLRKGMQLLTLQLPIAQIHEVRPLVNDKVLRERMVHQSL